METRQETIKRKIKDSTEKLIGIEKQLKTLVEQADPLNRKISELQSVAKGLKNRIEKLSQEKF